MNKTTSISNKVVNKFIDVPARSSKSISYRIFFVLLITTMFISSASASVTDLSISPSNPVVGDTITISGSASPDESINAVASFTKSVDVSGGKYEYLVEDVEIPDGPNNFKVRAEGVENLNVRVKILIWLTKSSDASGGVAVVSQSSVPEGTYKIKIDGTAQSEEENVDLTITGTQTIQADSSGHFQYSYSTKSIPVGDFQLNVGGQQKTITLRSTSSGSGSSGGSSSSGSGGITAGSGESADNIAVKEVQSKRVYKGQEVICQFSETQNPVKYINFTSKKNNIDQIPITVEVLQGTSEFVNTPAEGLVYRNVNIWVGYSGFATTENIENAIVDFSVDNNWMEDNNIDQDSINLMHYDESSDSWEKLTTELIEEGDTETHYRAYTTSFSPFAIVGEEKEMPFNTEEETSTTKVEEEQDIGTSNPVDTVEEVTEVGPGTESPTTPAEPEPQPFGYGTDMLIGLSTIIGLVGITSLAKRKL